MLVKLQLTLPANDNKNVVDPLGVALGMLVRAHRYAANAHTSRWQYAVELEELRDAGVAKSDLRWLVASGLTLHAKEIAGPAVGTRKFVALPPHQLPPGSCFVLSDAGILEVEKIALLAERPAAISTSHLHNVLATQQLARGETARHCHLPHWDNARRELRLNATIVKRFRNRAANQEAVLAAFQEEGWPPRIDDPLPPMADQDSRRRLSDAIKCLNCKQVNSLIRFHGDGTSKGVLWEFREKGLTAIV